MKLCIKQKVFSWNDKFNVYDEYGNERYYVEGELFTLGKKLHVYRNQSEVLYIQQRLLTFLSKYEIFVAGCAPVEISSKFTFFKPAYSIDELGWDIEGDFFAAHSYVIRKGEETVATIEKEWFTWGDCYVIDILNPADELWVLAAALAIDCVMAQQ